jgi:hypothetical protein
VIKPRLPEPLGPEWEAYMKERARAGPPGQHCEPDVGSPHGEIDPVAGSRRGPACHGAGTVENGGEVPCRGDV